MAVVIDPGRGALAEAIGNVGAAAGEVVFRKRRRERELSENRDELQSLLPAFRAAKAKGPEAVAAFENAIGVGEGFAAEHLEPAVVPTTAQLTQERATEVGLPQMLVDQAVLQSTFDTGELEAGLAANLPMLSALGKAEEAQAGIAENQYRGSYFTLLQDEGGVQARVTIG